MRSISIKLFYTFVCLSLMIVLVGVQPAYAAGIIVNSPADNTTAGDDLCTLREAINNANADADTTSGDCVGGSGVDIITFAANYTITLTSELPSVTTNITITGNGAANTIIQNGVAPQTGILRVLNIANTGTLTLQNLTVANGGCGGSCSVDGLSGGGILNQGTLNITNSTISGHRANGGGGIKNEGTLTVTNSSFFDNRANVGDGGAIVNVGTVTIIGSTFSGNFASFGGSGLFNSTGGTATIENSTFTGNTATDSIIFTYTPASPTITTIRNSTVANNSSGTGAVRASGPVTLNISNTIMSGNTTGPDCINSGGTIGVNTNNLIQTNAAGLNACGTPALSADPQLGVLANNGGLTQTMALLPGSPAIDAGTNTNCPATDQRGATRDSACDIGAYEYVLGSLTFKSSGTLDGWTLESAENSNVGGTKNNTAKTLRVGDDALNNQYRAILSFNTASLPDNAPILSTTLRVKRQGITGGGNPIKTFGGFMVDVKKGAFGKSALQLTDFQTKGSQTLGAFKPIISGGWYSINLTPASEKINKLGITQIRLRFKTGDNNNFAANVLNLYSGNAGSSNAPQLIVEYVVGP
jgi:CSLREA domain-containing protein